MESEEATENFTNFTLKKKHKDFLEVLNKKAGNVSEACKAFKISRRQYYNWYEDIPEFKQGADDIQEALIDFAESQLLLNIKDKKETSIIFFLKTKGKKRGYIEKTETELSGNTKTVISFREM